MKILADVLWAHIERNPGHDRDQDIRSKMDDLLAARTSEEIDKAGADLMQSTAMWMLVHGRDPDKALHNRNDELVHRLASTGSMFSKPKT